MAQTLGKNLRRRGALPVLLTAIGIAAWLVVERAVGAVTWLTAYAVPTNQGEFNDAPGIAADYGFVALQQFGFSVLWDVLPVALGVFASLWMVAPVAGELAMRFVVARAVLATGCGIVLYIVAQFAKSGYEYFAAGFNPALDAIPGNALQLWTQFGYALTNGITFFFATLPLVVLGVVLLWLWLRNRDPKHPVYGILDEV